MKILIGIIGDFYKYQVFKYTNNGQEIDAKCSLFALMRMLNPDLTLLVVLDSLVDILNKKYPELKSSNSYIELKGRLVKVVRQGLLSEKIVTQEELNEFKVKFLIIPSVGSYGDLRFKGEITDFYYELYYGTGLKFAGLLAGIKNFEEDAEIFFDVSLGANYTNVILYKVLRELAAIFSLSGRRVKLRILNTEPIIPYRENSTSALNEIEAAEFRKSLTFSTRKLKGSELPLKNISKEYVKAKENYKEELNSRGLDLRLGNRDVSCFLSSVKNGIPLGVYYFFPDISLLSKVARLSYKFYLKSVKFHRDESLIIERGLKLTPCFKTYVQAILVAQALSSLGVEKRESVLSSEIESLSEKLYERCKVIGDRIKQEISRLNKEIRNYPKARWKVMGEEKSRGNTVRNFFAHVGIVRNLTEIWVEDEKSKVWKVRFRKTEESIKQIANFLLNAADEAE
ncbi:MAG: CRISPR-associated CARF protein Csx1 [Candidatus Hydrothermia bacterium]